MHNKMEIEGAASDAARPQAADFPCEAGRMRRFDGQICSFGGKNADESAQARCYVNFKEVKDRRNGTANSFCVRLRPGAWHGLNCTRRCRSTANCWRCATRCGSAARFVNHCCEPNCETRLVTVAGTRRIVVYAKRLILPGEELAYDYKFPLDDQYQIPCHCGAKRCRGRMN